MSHPATQDAVLEIESLEIGSGHVEALAGGDGSQGWRLALGPSQRYGDAQLDDHHDPRRRILRWTPPVRLSLSARSSSASPAGTFGFGFWNDPFSVGLGVQGGTRRLPRPPQTAWFFHASSRSDLRLSPDVAGDGWKTATLQSRPVHPALLLPGAAAAFLGMQLPPLRQWMFSLLRQFYWAEETRLHFDPSQWHSYVIDWREDRVVFLMDGEIQAVSAEPPRPPLGLVIWIDNQFAVVSPEKGMRFGVEPMVEAQWLEIARLRVQSM